MIPFNKLFHTGNELTYIADALKNDRISGDGIYTQRCETFFETKFGFKKAMLTSSCTHSLEMCALLTNIQPGDEVIMPSYTFVSMANAFVLRGAVIRFADSAANSPNVDANVIEDLITSKTKAIVVIHYGGIASEVDKIKTIADKHNLYLIEDAAHAVDSYYKGKALGGFGQLATFSFHDTKNITCGEGGMLVINDEHFAKRSEILREKGTNHAAFLRNEVSRYNWVDIGSSFLTSDVSAAYLYAQFLDLDNIQRKRKNIWNIYYHGLKALEEKGFFKLPFIPEGANHNAHIFYIVCKSMKTRDAYISHMRTNEIKVQFHYLTLHDSPYYQSLHDGRDLPNAKQYAECLVRLPLFAGLTDDEINLVIKNTYDFFIKDDE